DRMVGEATRLLSGAILAPRAAGDGAAPTTSDLQSTVVNPVSGSGPGRAGEDPRIGSTIGGRYHVRRLCGEGAMGRVYEAHHVDIGRRVAIKVLHASFQHD